MNFVTIFGTENFLDTKDFVQLLARLGFNLVFVGLIVLLYFRLYRNREFIFTYFVFNVITFTLCASLRKVPVELGFALGLFAVFGILRYRTEEIKLRDLNYQFVVIGIGIVNAVANKKISFAELLAVNVVIVGMCFLLELWPAIRHDRVLPVLYDNLSLLHPGKQSELFADLDHRLGIRVIQVQIHRIDTLRDAAEITVFYTVPEPPSKERPS
jgi:hypothetical protein